MLVPVGKRMRMRWVNPEPVMSPAFTPASWICKGEGAGMSAAVVIGVW